MGSLAEWALLLLIWLLGLSLTAIAGVLLFIYVHRRFVFASVTAPERFTVAFFHPYCNAGGGGERVLWCAVASLGAVTDAANLRVVIYTGDVGVAPKDMIKDAQTRFGITIPEELEVEFVFVRSRGLLEAARYPRFTMLGQSWGSMRVAYECLSMCVPDVWLDTTGAAFTFPVAKLLARCLVGCYVHYPTITTDMMRRVHERRPTYNNDADIARSAAASTAKLLYYRAFAWLYRRVGGFADVVMTNSSWTRAHIDELWALPSPSLSDELLEGFRPVTDTLPSLMRALSADPRWRPVSQLVYPPCNTEVLQTLPLGHRQRLVVSVGQFRPEKDHELQLRAFAEFRRRDAAYRDVQLHIIGSCRDDGDRARVDKLRVLTRELELDDAVTFRVNIPLSELRQALGSAMAGMHTMWNEHFGIGIVEMMAAGAIPIAHNSGGPRADIVVPYNGVRTGFLAATAQEYADALVAVFSGATDVTRMATAARQSAARFSDGVFGNAFFSGVVAMVNEARLAARARERDATHFNAGVASGRKEA